MKNSQVQIPFRIPHITVSEEDKKEADERQIFYRHYLIDLAKKSDRLNNEAVKKIFVNIKHK